MRSVVVVIALAGCHVIARDQLTRPIATERVVHTEGATPGKPTLVLTDAGQLRFVEPLACPTEEHVTVVSSVEVVKSPNLATFVVGLVATSVGVAMTVQGITADEPARAPGLYAGLVLLGGGLPASIGPWVGNTTRTEPGGRESKTTRPGPPEPCGARALAARSATLRVRNLEVHGRIDGDGVFAISPYQLVDAYAPVASGAWDVRATVEADGGTHAIQVMIDGGALATRAKAFLAAAPFDARVEPMRLVPGLTAGTLRASLASTDAGPAVRLVLPVSNAGPGPSWGLRGVVVAPAHPAIDGRVLYLGHLAKGSTGELTALVPVTAATAAELRNAAVDLSIELRDAHGTAPTTPARFRGTLLVDAPR